MSDCIALVNYLEGSFDASAFAFLTGYIRRYNVLLAQSVAVNCSHFDTVCMINKKTHYNVIGRHRKGDQISLQEVVEDIVSSFPLLSHPPMAGWPSTVFTLADG
jgi:hypothetical protein